MPDYRTMFEKEHIGVWDLAGRDVTVEISAVKAGRLPAMQGRKATKKPILSFKGKEKTLVCNATNGATIAAMYGPRTEDWIGKRITLYGTTTSFGGQTVECVRIRPKVPSGKSSDASLNEPVDREVRDAQNEAASEYEQGGESDGE